MIAVRNEALRKFVCGEENREEATMGQDGEQIDEASAGACSRQSKQRVAGEAIETRVIGKMMVAFADARVGVAEDW